MTITVPTDTATQQSAIKATKVLSKKAELGQFFTVNLEVQNEMMRLLTPPRLDEGEKWRLLEPSCGAGHLLKSVFNNSRFEGVAIDAVGWELDDSVPPVDSSLDITYGDFFKLAQGTEESFHSLVGNPPYVAWKNTTAETQALASATKSIYSDKVNLYHLFIDRCIDLLVPNGELVFIVPKEWLYSTSAAVLRAKIQREGTITHIIDGGEEKVFPDADVPAIIVFRFEKNPKEASATNRTLLDSPTELEDAFERSLGSTLHYRKGLTSATAGQWEQRKLVVLDSGFWLIVDSSTANEVMAWKGHVLGDLFSVKVGMVSGADRIFNVSSHPNLKAFIAEGSAVPMATTKGLEYYIETSNFTQESNIPAVALKHLGEHKDTLMSRRIARFDESNWWKWGAVRNKETMTTHPERIYAFAKTRQSSPFFIGPEKDDFGNEVRMFGGGLLAIFSKSDRDDQNANSDDWRQSLMAYLNSPLARDVFEAMGMTTANKLSLQPSTLEALPLPDYLV